MVLVSEGFYPAFCWEENDADTGYGVSSSSQKDLLFTVLLLQSAARAFFVVL